MPRNRLLFYQIKYLRKYMDAQKKTNSPLLLEAEAGRIHKGTVLILKPTDKTFEHLVEVLTIIENYIGIRTMQARYALDMKKLRLPHHISKSTFNRLRDALKYVGVTCYIDK